MADLFRRERAEADVRAHGEHTFPMRAQVNQTHTRHDLMRPALQLLQHCLRFGERCGLAQNLAVEKDERVRTYDKCIRKFPGHSAGFAMRVELTNLERRQLVIGQFSRIARQNLKLQVELRRGAAMQKPE
jgi:hypothetical protein